MRNKLCCVDFITLWDDGVISVDDGVGYTGELCTMETMELYQALRKFFEVEKVSSHNSSSHKMPDYLELLSTIDDSRLTVMEGKADVRVGTRLMYDSLVRHFGR